MLRQYGSLVMFKSFNKFQIERNFIKEFINDKGKE